MPVYYPVFLNISGKECFVIGGGKVAERKIFSLLKAKANVTVISEDLTNRLFEEHRKGKIRFIQKRFDAQDIQNAYLVIAATSDTETNKLVAQKAPFLVNVADNPSLSNFIVPSVVHKKELTIAICTEGASPALSSLIKEDIEALYGRDIGFYITFLKGFRKKVIEEIKDSALRRRILTFAASRSILDTLKKDGYNKAKDRLISFYMNKRGQIE